MRKNTVEKRKILSTQRDIKILIFCPTVSKKEPGKTPGILWLHGGGYATGMAKMAYFSRPLALVKKYGANVCVSDEARNTCISDANSMRVRFV